MLKVRDDHIVLQSEFLILDSVKHLVPLKVVVYIREKLHWNLTSFLWFLWSSLILTHRGFKSMCAPFIFCARRTFFTAILSLLLIKYSWCTKIKLGTFPLLKKWLFSRKNTSKTFINIVQQEHNSLIQKVGNCRCTGTVLAVPSQHWHCLKRASTHIHVLC